MSAIKLLTSFLVIIYFSSFFAGAQPAKTSVIGEIPSERITAIRATSSKESNYYLVFPAKKGVADSVLFHSEFNQAFDFKNCEIKTLQIDGKGRPEVIISWQVDTTISEYGEKGRSYHWAKQQIWNLDTYQEIFHTTYSYYYHAYRVKDNTQQPDAGAPTEVASTVCKFKHDLEIDTKGNITIRNIMKEVTGTCDVSEFDIYREGVYVYKDGKYVLGEKL